MYIEEKVVQYISSSFWKRKLNEQNFFCTVVTFIPSLYCYHFWFPKRCYCFFSEILIFESSTFNFFIDILFRIIIVCKCYTTFHVLLLFFNGRWICAFSLCPRVSVFSKNLAVFTLINQLMQMLSSRDFLSNECSRNVQKVVEKLYLWVNSFLTEMQFFSVQLDFHRENKIHRCLSRIFLKHLRNNYFAGQLLMAITLHGLSGLCAYIVL